MSEAVPCLLKLRQPSESKQSPHSKFGRSSEYEGKDEK